MDCRIVRGNQPLLLWNGKFIFHSNPLTCRAKHGLQLIRTCQVKVNFSRFTLLRWLRRPHSWAERYGISWLPDKRRINCSRKAAPRSHAVLNMNPLTCHINISPLNPACFTPFCFNAPCQFTPLLNLRSLIFGTTPFG